MPSGVYTRTKTRIVSDETCQKISKALTKYQHEFRNCPVCDNKFEDRVGGGKVFCTRNCSAKFNNNRKGKKASLETREKLRISHLGFKCSEETKAKISKAHKRKIFTEEHCKNIAKNRKSSLRSNSYSSISEVEFGNKIFEKFNIKLHHSFWIFDKENKIRYCYDYKVPHKNILIECDGTYWHSLPGRKERDEQKENLANKLGYSLYRFDLNQAIEVEKLIEEKSKILKEILS